jgi:hypothetical protein
VLQLEELDHALSQRRWQLLALHLVLHLQSDMLCYVMLGMCVCYCCC